MAELTRSLEEKISDLESQLKIANAERIKYKQLFEASGDALSIIDLSTGKFTECNQAAVDMHGVKTKDNFLNLTPADISPEFQPCGHSSQELAEKHIQNSFTEGPQLFQWQHCRLDGSSFPCLVSLTALPLEDQNLILAIGRDISELVETQDRLERVISEKMHFETAYLEEKEKFEKFVNLAPIGIAINRLEDGAFEYVNNEFSRFTGYEVDELNTLDYWQLTPKKYEAQEFEQLQSLAEYGRYGPYQKEYIHKQGHTYPVLLSGIKIAKNDGQEYIWSVVQDISQQKQIEQQIQVAWEKAESMAFRMKLANDSAGIGVWEWDVLSNELIWDDWMYTLYGVSKAEFSGAYEAWENSVHPDDIEDAKTKLFEAVQGCGIYNPEFRVIHPNGQVRTLKASAEVIKDDKGNTLKVIGVNYDITDKVEAIKALSLAKQEAERASQTKSKFLANMSHEIRTPMNAVLGGLQLLNNQQLTQENQTILDNASWSAKSLLTIINDILDYSKIEDNKLKLEQKPLSLIKVLDSVKFDMAIPVNNKGIEFVSIIDNNFIDGWVGDIVRIKQILLNLVSNAVKFTERGNVKVVLSCIQYQEQQAVCFKVIDTGIGMSKEVQNLIFERFSQADTSTTRKFGGTGLGMSITDNLIKIMGGTIEIESEPGKGTQVQVILPLEKAEQASIKEKHTSADIPNLAGKKILIAEDNEINQMILESMLKVTKAEITIVNNGQLAVDVAKKQDFNIVLMDIQMPQMDGLEAQQKIRQIKKDLPIVALTANAMLEDVKLYLSQGFVEHVSKPIDIQLLYGVLEHYLN
ncbi:PAS domain S-box protein [Catenovulum maritimum]|uniref:Sensory/regulatory protein RpfC n=1 Tax=Catenovulum maritimum TaxID=1513271 RepID=A0A0J8GVJ6_9ALTE|nr:PAS domain S-box protein [Catenovulum maritimum]KMT66810.1 histidine kinase [Catenovulum maritimum]